jgi:UDP-N-acetylmuramate--alanine ligase
MEKDKKNIHLVGIGGIGVSSLARYFHSEGFFISGSDASSCPDDFKEKGIKTFIGHRKENLLEGTDLLIYSHAVNLDNPELEQAKKVGVKIQSYSEVLGELTKKYYTIAVSGTHGKSTTTAMISKIMIDAGLDPTVIIGTKIKDFGNTNFRKGRSKYLVIEADESSAGFLKFYPEIGVINNIEADHLDFYNDVDEVVSTFEKYITDNLKNKTIIINSDDKNISKIKNKFQGEVVEFSLKSNKKEKIKLSVPGDHNIYNALAAFYVARKVKIKKEIILESLFNFKGTWRRFQEKKITLKNKKSLNVINDYAHHPTELEVTLKAAREKYPEKKIVAVFQPHQYKRTHHLLSSFQEVICSSSSFIDLFLVTDIYSVKGRESEEIIKKVNSRMLCGSFENVIYSGSIKETGDYLQKTLQGEEILLIMGAGDIYGNLEKYITL